MSWLGIVFICFLGLCPAFCSPGCDIPDEEQITEDCERIVDEQISAMQEWIVFLLEVERRRVLTELGCVPLVPEGWDCSRLCGGDENP